jgi:flagellar basal body-associated protein FliL
MWCLDDILRVNRKMACVWVIILMLIVVVGAVAAVAILLVTKKCLPPATYNHFPTSTPFSFLILNFLKILSIIR